MDAIRELIKLEDHNQLELYLDYYDQMIELMKKRGVEGQELILEKEILQQHYIKVLIK